MKKPDCGCNWLQGLEGDIDTSHFGFLHAGAIDPEEMPGGTFSKYVTNNRLWLT